MNRSIAGVFLALTLTSSIAVAHVPDQPSQKVGAMNNAFALDLYVRLASKDGNLFFSPTSIQTALAMAWAGARGKTAGEMASTLHLDSEPQAATQLGALLRTLNESGIHGGYELSIANAMWGMKGYPFLPAYLQVVEKNYDGHLAELNFPADAKGSRQVINQWVADQTHDKIKDLMPRGSIASTTRLVITNAIYFKGKWTQPFQQNQTHDADFFSSPGHKTTVPFMFQLSHFRYAEDANLQVLELSYGTDELAMWIFLPRKADQLAAIERGLTPLRFTDLSAELENQDVQVWLPKFEMNAAYHLEDILPAMGMKLAFESGRADFSGMTSEAPFMIDAVIHKAYVKTDEEGTEAAAATGVGMRATAVMVRHQPKQFRADHPFVFAIVHQPSGAILFMGRVNSP